MFDWNIAIGRPLVLVLLLLVPLLWWAGRQARSALGPFRGWLAFGLRAIVVILVIMALADTQLRQSSRSVTVLYLLDQSLSIPAADREAMFDYVAAEVDAYRQKSRGDRIGVIVFGREAMVEVPPLEDSLEWLVGEESLQRNLAVATNLADAGRLAISVLPDEGARRVVFVTDGNENIGDVRQVAPQLARLGIGMDVIAIEHEPVVDVAVEKVSVPALSKQGEPNEVRVLVRYDAAPEDESTETSAPSADADQDRSGVVSGRLRVTRQLGQETRLISDEEVQLKPGVNGFRLVDSSEMDPGFYVYQAEFVPEGTRERTVDNNRAQGFTNRTGVRRVLWIENRENAGESQHLINRLRQAELLVDVKSHAEAFTSLADLQSYDSLVLADVPRASGQFAEVQFGDDQVEALVRNTELGCGLVVLGGPNSFGAGGWANTRLEEACPVNFTIKNTKVIPSGALVLVIDKSGSMDGDKLAMSRQAAIEAVRVLGAADEVGVVVFDGSAYWAVPLQKVENRRETIVRQIRKVTSGGGTDLYAGMVQAFDSLRSSGAAVKHMIVLTDGQTQAADFGLLMDRMREANITLSSVGVGQDADRVLLPDLAIKGRGKYYQVISPTAIPRIFVKEAMRITKPLVFERPEGFSPQVGFPHEVLQGLGGAMPPITGYVLTEVKDSPLVEVGLQSPVPGDPSTSTILASWNYGLGRVMVLTTDGGQRWAASWTQQEQVAALYERIVRWSMRPTEQYGNFLVNAEFEDGRLRLVVSGLDENGDFLNFLPMLCSVTQPDLGSREMVMRQVAPGRYTGEIPVQDPGSYLLTVNPGLGGGVIRTGVNVPWAKEYEDRQANIPLLQSLAAYQPQDGQPGMMVRDEDVRILLAGQPRLDAFRPNLAAAISLQEIWPLLLLVAAVVFFGDVFVRRVAVDPASAVAGWVARFRGDSLANQPDPRLERLRQRKESERQRAGWAQADAKFDSPNVGSPMPSEAQLPGSPGSQSGSPASVSKPKIGPGLGAVTGSSGSPQADSYTDRLLKAKRQASRESQSRSQPFQDRNDQ